MSEQLAEAFAVLPDYLGGHMRLSMAAIACAILISLPLGILAARRNWLAGPALGFAGTLQTIPGLALLALMVPVLGGAIGFAPAFVALTLYGILPILRNTIVGLQAVDPVVREAARGVGMTRQQALIEVELPLALPTIVAGIRTAVVWVVGAAVLATPVGASSLGNYIFAGLQTRNWTAVLFGCVVSALLAILLDQIVRNYEIAARQRNRMVAGLATLGGVILIGAALAPGWINAGSRQAGENVLVEAVGLEGRTVVVASKPFTEQYILVALMERVLEDEGAIVERRDGLGTAVIFDALANNEIDVSIDYSGTLWTNTLRREDMIGRYRMMAVINAFLLEQYGIYSPGSLGFENAYGFAMSREGAERLGVTSIADLAGQRVTIGADTVFFNRPEWTGTREAYGLQDATPRPMDSTFMYGAVRDGQVDVITAYTTDGRIPAYDLVILEDPRAILPPYDAMILLSPEAAADDAVAAALAPLVNAITPEMMREANRRVDLDGQTPEQAADWLWGEIGG
ncbi:ABC transporter permease/substrate-binding protein [Hyphobacterium sp. HN65]|uniref:ABC transporter permease/substrate-binding protein n=1 Tax=Hyphobacterium lacteum TaxID=3116575 RepID=A0ABU7LTN1_9PROT|nr:ABC transporter permease/substrate-binding protein [Hyphobacterium sp. HN65]MEE2527257.1 ABC transporter permease/substrate-binding protein [Hyphobacterium sp. HN65]